MAGCYSENASCNDSTVVEFMGLPAAGKSRLANEVARLLRAEGTIVTEPSNALDARSPRLHRVASKLLLAGRTYARRPLLSHRWICAVARSRQKSKAQMIAKLIYWFSLVETMNRSVRYAGVHVFDQGLFQALWSLAYDARELNLADAGLRAQLAATYASTHTVIICVNVQPESLLLRLRSRHGMSRLDRDIRCHSAARIKRAHEDLQRVRATAVSIAGDLQPPGSLHLIDIDNEGSVADAARTIAEHLSWRGQNNAA